MWDRDHVTLFILVSWATGAVEWSSLCYSSPKCSTAQDGSRRKQHPRTRGGREPGDSSTAAAFHQRAPCPSPFISSLAWPGSHIYSETMHEKRHECPWPAQINQGLLLRMKNNCVCKKKGTAGLGEGGCRLETWECLQPSASPSN